MADTKELRARLRLIYRIASRRIYYGSDFGRVCTIERLSDLRRSVKRELSGEYSPPRGARSVRR